MAPVIQKLLISALVGVISFLGWQPKDYANHLPKEIGTIIENNGAATSSPISPSVNKTSKPAKESIPIAVSKKPQISSPKTLPTISPLPIVQTSPSSIPKQIINENPPKSAINSLTPENKTVGEPSSPPTQNEQNQTVEAPIDNSIEGKIKSATANILCSERVPQGIEKFTGSAVAISPAGVFITNSHVALYILLEETLSTGDMSCFIRTGSPAKKAYKAEIVYIPKAWVMNNKNILNTSSPSGSGEKDYALIRVTSSLQNNYLTSVPYLDRSIKNPSINDSIYLSGYPAGFSNGDLLDSSLYEMEQNASIRDIFGFDTFSADSFGTSPTLLAEKGSSGGGITDADGKLLGIMFATTLDNYTNQKNIRGITLSYINRDILKDTGKDLDWYVTNATEEASRFRTEDANSLSNILTNRSY